MSRKSTSPSPSDTTGVSDPKTGVVRLPASNLYQDATKMDMYAYLSTLELIESGSQFPEQLLWKQTGLIYGDWTSGPEGDGCFSHSLQLETTEVRIG